MSDILLFPGLKTDIQNFNTLAPPVAERIAPFFSLYPGTRQKRHEALERVRDWVREVVGCGNTVRVLFDLLAGRIDEWELSYLLKTSHAEVCRRVAHCHDLIRAAAVAEAVVASLSRESVAWVDPRSARVLSGDDSPPFAVPIPETDCALPALEKELVSGYLHGHAKQVRRERELPLYLLGRHAGEDGAVALDLVHAAESWAEAKKLTRRLRTNRIINLAGCLGKPRSRRVAA